MSWKAVVAALAGAALGIGAACFLRRYRSCGGCEVHEIGGSIVYMGRSPA